MFEHYLSDGSKSSVAPKPAQIVSSLRQYYPDDTVLMQFADFVEDAVTQHEGVTFKSQTQHVKWARSTDCSIKLF